MKILSTLFLAIFLTISISAQQQTPTPTPTPTVKETVNISANFEQTVEKVSKTINTISGQEMRDRADFSLVESLKTIPGFRVQQLGGFGRTANIKTRGLRNQDTAILIDGIRFRDATAITGDASSFLSDFTLTSVSKLEVLRGSGSSLYGTNAIGGVIDFQTPKPQSGLHGQFSTAFGGYGLQRYRGNLSDGTKDGKFGFNLGGSRTLYTKGIDNDDRATNTNFQSRLEFNPTQNTNISGRFFVSDAFVKLNSNPDTKGALPASNATIINANQGVNFVYDVNDPDNSQKSNFFSGQVALTQIITDKLIFQGYYQGLKTQRRNENGTLGVGFQSASTSIFDGQIHTANGHFNWSPNRVNEITFGYEFEQEKFGNNGFTPSGTGSFFTKVNQSSNTFYAQDLLSFLNNKLQLAGGFRAQFFNLDKPAFSVSNAPYSNVTLSNPPTAYTFDGSGSYFFEKSKTKLRAHVGNGYRVPSLYERFGTFYSSFSSSFTALGDPNLKPEKTIAFDGGIEQNLFDSRAKFSATYFYTKLIDTIGYGNVVANIGSTTRPFGGYLNTKGGIAKGTEFSADLKPHKNTSLFASYTFTNSDQREPQVSGSRIIDTLGIPKHQFTLVATQRFKDFWVNLDFVATSNYLAPIFSNTTFGTYVYRFKGNRKADLTAGYTFKMNNEKLNLRLFGTVENLFNYEYFENGFRTFGRTGRVGLSFGF
ncbi:MAG: TonB-dependent receptor [Pyrinomonadaceae bacterium]|nr:TonB-dependent receptor [Pyrinomonadaceae bacterium]